MADNSIENEVPETKKDSFLANFRNRYPDLPEDDGDAVYGKLGEEFDKFDKSDKAQKELGDLLASDPRSTEFLMMMRKGGNPVEFLIEKYGAGGLLERIIINSVNKDDWMTLMKAGSYDKSMAEAREEGEITGRNANIDIKKKKQIKAESRPANLGSGGGRTPVEKKGDPMLERINQITSKKSVWDD